MEFNGDPTTLKTIKNLFQEIKDEQEKGNGHSLPHWLPPFVTNIGFADEYIHYRSRWIPNTEALLQIATKYDVGFINKYQELGMGIFGETSYINGVYTDIRLDGRDFKDIHFDEKQSSFIFESKTYNDDWPIMQQLLERKKAMELNFNTISDITKEQLLEIYNELLPTDFVLKFAEHKNFDGARKAFFDLDDYTARRLSDYIADNDWNNPEKYVTHDKYIAMNFLRKLVTEWDWQQQGRQNQNGYNR